MLSPARPQITLFASDLDGTLVGDPASTRRFRQAWEQLPARARPRLVYNSGRPVNDVRALVALQGLPAPDFIVGGVGTELHEFRADRTLTELRADFGDGWDLAKIETIVGAMPGVAPQSPEFLHSFKSSWHLHCAEPAQIDALRRRLQDAGLDVNVVYSSARDLDVLPRRADKGRALAWLCRRLGVPLEQVLVAGDTGNDTAMFLLPGVRGIVVGNAQPELLGAVENLSPFVSREAMADGVIAGLKHFGILPAAC